MVLAAGPFGLGAPELILIVIVIALVFGVGKLADIGGVLGRSIREFRRELREESAPQVAEKASQPSSGNAAAGTGAGTVPAVECSKCGSLNKASAKFCAECGSELKAPVA
ncbi:MAG TPA: twin-arginine translocase TatA/TatE family subunit [Dehalococcoidia bacterium]|nr:twin-arginine translocase TatA/TatE family subunit [Dehalococcoidia bacterium]